MAGRIAITRGVSPNITRCELTHLERQTVDVAAAIAQHAAYQVLLSGLGCDVRRLAAEPEFPDSVFVEDAAIVLDELAVIMEWAFNYMQKKRDLQRTLIESVE